MSQIPKDEADNIIVQPMDRQDFSVSHLIGVIFPRLYLISEYIILRCRDLCISNRAAGISILVFVCTKVRGFVSTGDDEAIFRRRNLCR